jgi:hypothetical protein
MGFVCLLWCNFSTFITHDRGRVFSEPPFVFGRMILSTRLKYLLDSLPVVFSGLQWPRTIAIDLITV